MKKAFTIGCWLLVVLCLAGTVLYMDANVDSMLDGDMSGELILAKLLSEEKAIMSQNWIYSNELRVLNTQLVFTPLFWIFDDWHTIRVVGTAILYVIYLASAYYCCRQLGIRRMFPLVGMLLLCPLSFWYFIVFLKGTYYIAHVVISFCIIGMLAQHIRCKNQKKRIWLLAAMALLSLVAGMGGLRQLLVLYIPLVVTAVCVQYQRKEINMEKIVQEGALLPSIVSSGFAAVGFAINKLILAKIYTFNQFDNMSFTDFSLERMLTIFQDTLNFFGYRTGKVFSGSLVYQLLMALLVVITLAAVIRFFPRKAKEIEPQHALLGMFLPVAMAIYVLLYAFTDHYYSATYELPIMVFAFVLIGAYFEQCKWKPAVKNLSVGLLMVLLVVCGGKTYQRYTLEGMPESRGLPLEYAAIAEQMEQGKYLQGYSTAWAGGDALTELTNGNIEMFLLSRTAENLDDCTAWLQLKSHATTKPDGRFFVMVQMSDYQSLPVAKRLDSRFEVYRSERYVVYAFESIDEYTDNLLTIES